MSRNSDSDLVIVIAIAVVIGVCSGIVSVFGVTWKVAFEVFINLLVWGLVIGFITYSGFLGGTWPIFCGWLILAFAPVLNHWAGGRFGDPLYIEPSWYGKALWQWVMAMSLVGAGYGFKWWQKSRYYY